MFNERDRRCAAVQLMLTTDQSYDNRTIASTLKMQIWIATNNRDVPRGMKTKFPATVMVFGVVSSLKSAWKSTPKRTWMCWRVWWSPGAIRWSVADPRSGKRIRRRPTSPKRPRLGFRRSATTLYPSLTGPASSPDLNPLDYFVWSYVENITNITSHNTKARLITAISRVFTELRRRLWKRHAPSSRQWLRLKATTLNRCQLYYIIKLPELIFSIKVLK